MPPHRVKQAKQAEPARASGRRSGTSRRSQARGEGRSRSGEAGVQKEKDRAALFFLIFSVVVIGAVLIGGVWLSRSWASGPKEDFTYNYFPFERLGDFWVTSISVEGRPYAIQLYYHPSEVENISFDPAAKALIVDKRPKRLFVALDPDAGSVPVIAGVEIAKITGTGNQILNIPTRSAFFGRPPAQNAEGLVVTCDTADENTTVVWIHVGEQTRVAASGDCILVEGATAQETVRAADRLVFALLGIMPENPQSLPAG
ncbi:hypothetical protein D6783_00430 [Candidatus Woesearchaeota archaeon]|nr:MAG: hypothetical protein D6783_00430 [Candidatus Woesearchaeota archaeon]